MDLHDIYSIYESFNFIKETDFDFSSAYRKNILLLLYLGIILWFMLSDFFPKTPKIKIFLIFVLFFILSNIASVFLIYKDHHSIIEDNKKALIDFNSKLSKEQRKYLNANIPIFLADASVDVGKHCEIPLEKQTLKAFNADNIIISDEKIMYSAMEVKCFFDHHKVTILSIQKTKEFKNRKNFQEAVKQKFIGSL